jgi:hypothetical protein
MIYTTQQMKKQSQRTAVGLVPIITRACKSLLGLVYSIFVLILGGVMNSAHMSFDELLTVEKEENNIKFDDQAAPQVKLYDMDVAVQATEIPAADAPALETPVIKVTAIETADDSTSAKKKKNKKKKNKKVDNQTAATNVTAQISPQVMIPALPQPVDNTATPVAIPSTQSISPKLQQKETKGNNHNNNKFETTQVKNPKSVLKRAYPTLKAAPVSVDLVRPVRQPLTPPSLMARGFSQAYRQSRTIQPVQ